MTHNTIKAGSVHNLPNGQISYSQNAHSYSYGSVSGTIAPAPTFADYYEARVNHDQFIREKRIREQFPAAQAAYDEYQVIIKLCEIDEIQNKTR